MEYRDQTMCGGRHGKEKEERKVKIWTFNIKKWWGLSMKRWQTAKRRRRKKCWDDMDEQKENMKRNWSDILWKNVRGGRHCWRMRETRLRYDIMICSSNDNKREMVGFNMFEDTRTCYMVDIAKKARVGRLFIPAKNEREMVRDIMKCRIQKMRGGSHCWEGEGSHVEMVWPFNTHEIRQIMRLDTADAGEIITTLNIATFKWHLLYPLERYYNISRVRVV